MLQTPFVADLLKVFTNVDVASLSPYGQTQVNKALEYLRVHQQELLMAVGIETLYSYLVRPDVSGSCHI